MNYPKIFNAESLQISVSHLKNPNWSIPHASMGVNEECPYELRYCKQVHGVNVVEASQASPEVEADGIISREPGLFVGVQTADCLPLLFSDRSHTIVAAVHAGWRGLFAGIVQETIERLKSLVKNSSELECFVGPAIGVQSFEVGPDLIEQLYSSKLPFDESELKAFIRPGKGDRSFVDLKSLVYEVLMRNGLRHESIVVSEIDTKTDAAWHSYRRDHSKAGRNWTWIGLQRG